MEPNKKGARGSPVTKITPELCDAYRDTVNQRFIGQDEKIETSEKNIIFTVKLVGAVSAIILSVAQFLITLYFLGPR